eukprot:1458959-Pleurochrysis_carterae.AAC.3
MHKVANEAGLDLEKSREAEDRTHGWSKRRRAQFDGRVRVRADSVGRVKRASTCANRVRLRHAAPQSAATQLRSAAEYADAAGTPSLKKTSAKGAAVKGMEAMQKKLATCR